MAKIYLASSWRNAEQPDTVKALRAAGHQVYDFRNPIGQSGFAWSEVDVNWQQWTAQEYREALKHPRSVTGFKSDFDAMKWADVGLLLLPCGRSAHLELGWMAGQGKHTIIQTRDGEEPELMALMCDAITTTFYETVTELRIWQRGVTAQVEAAANKKYNGRIDKPYADGFKSNV